MGRAGLLALVLVLGWWGRDRVVVAHPVGPAAPPEVLALEPWTTDLVLLRWRRQPHVDFRICFSTNPAFADFVACFPAGAGDAWPLGVPQEDGGLFYFTLQACREDGCTDPVRAGAVGRRAQDGLDFYALALPLPDGRVRLSASLRAGQAEVRYYRAAAGTAVRLDSRCPQVAAGETCDATEVALAGALAGVGAARPGHAELGPTFRVREEPTVYLLFDDGTGIVSGGRYLMQQVLDDYGVKGTFFLTGRAMHTYPEAVRALVAAGHRVGNHTWSHPFLTRLSDAAIAAELDRTEQQYRALVPGGTLRPCFRAPNGDLNARVLVVVDGRGYRQVAQTVSSLDWMGIPAERIVGNVLAGVRDGALISFHTQEPQTAIALRTLIPLLLAEGYRFGLAC